jgi:hypothetical protein
MKAVEFAYWLQGMFELNPPTQGLTTEQVELIRKHLTLVFKHEIDKSYPQSEKLDEIHHGSNGWPPSNGIIRC